MEISSPIPLVILDVQEAIDQPIWDQKSNPAYLDNIVKLLEVWRKKNWPVLHVKHDEASPQSTYYTDGPWNGFKKDVMPQADEPIIPKEQNCAFIGTDLDKALRTLNASTFILTGVVIHNSMDATIRAGKALGYHILLPNDATTAVPVKSSNGDVWDAETVHNLTASILDGEYAELTATEDILNSANVT